MYSEKPRQNEKWQRCRDPAQDAGVQCYLMRRRAALSPEVLAEFAQEIQHRLVLTDRTPLDVLHEDRAFHPLRCRRRMTQFIKLVLGKT